MSSNPFKQAASSYQISFRTKFKNIAFFEDFLELVSDSFTTHNIGSSGPYLEQENLWQIDAFFEGEPSISIEQQIEKIAKANDLVISKLERKIVDDLDWVTEVQKNFTPFEVGRFIIGPSADALSNYPSSALPIFIEASRAFGTGEHQTTKACIEALEKLAKNGQMFNAILDMGTGTGILAIAATKIWQKPLLAFDIEEIAVLIANNNFALNHTSQLAQAYVSDGYDSPILQNKKFDLIISNILAEPLAKHAPEIYNHLLPGGLCIISGFLESQFDDLISIFKQNGLELLDKITKDSWVAATLVKH